MAECGGECGGVWGRGYLREDVAEFACVHVVDEATDGEDFSKVGMGFEFCDLRADVFADGLEGVEFGWDGGGALKFVLEFGLELGFLNTRECTVGVAYDEELTDVCGVRGEDERAKDVFGCDVTCVADDEGLAGREAEGGVDGNATVHAGKNGEVHGGSECLRWRYALTGGGVAMIIFDDLIDCTTRW